MARKKKRSPRVPKGGPVWQRSAEQATLDRMPKFNGHACGTGAHGDAKYNRAKQNAAWRKQLNSEETRRSGSLSLMQGIASGELSCTTNLHRAPAG